jgi:hypothetical protein
MKTSGIVAAVALVIVPCSCAIADHATPPATLLYLDQQGWQQAARETKSALAADFMRVFCGNPAMPPADLVDCLDRSGDAGPVFTRAMACVATVPTIQ